MVKITPNCSGCMMLEKVINNTSCGTIIYFKCINKFIRIYGNPKLVICDEWEDER